MIGAIEIKNFASYINHTDPKVLYFGPTSSWFDGCMTGRSKLYKFFSTVLSHLYSLGFLGYCITHPVTSSGINNELLRKMLKRQIKVGPQSPDVNARVHGL